MNDQPNIALVKLDKKTWQAPILDYIAALHRKKEAAAEVRAADTVIATLRSRLYAALNGASNAICGNAVLTTRTTAGAAAALTLNDGSKVAWSKVTAVLVGNEQIPVREIATIYGGRSASDSIDVSGVP